MFDVSNRSQQKLIQYASEGYRFQRQLAASDRLYVFAFAHSENPIYEGHKILGRSKFNRDIAGALNRTNAALNAPGTDPATALSAIVKQLDATQERVVGIIFTDGGVEDRSNEATRRLLEEVRKLAGKKNLVALVVTGVDQEWRNQWLDWLAPLGGRAQVRGANDSRQALADALESLEESR